jgi:hypothetical protein
MEFASWRFSEELKRSLKAVPNFFDTLTQAIRKDRYANKS